MKETELAEKFIDYFSDFEIYKEVTDFQNPTITLLRAGTYPRVISGSMYDCAFKLKNTNMKTLFVIQILAIILKLIGVLIINWWLVFTPLYILIIRIIFDVIKPDDNDYYGILE